MACPHTFHIIVPTLSERAKRYDIKGCGGKINIYMFSIKNKATKRIFEFLIPYLMILIISTNIKAVIQSQYIYAFLLSMLISTFWIFNVNSITKGDNLSKLLYIVGGAFGAISGIALHDFFLSGL